MTCEVIDPAPRQHHREAGSDAAPADAVTLIHEEPFMSILHPSPFLRQILFADALASGACGVLMLGGSSLLAGPLGLPSTLLQISGLVLIPYAALVALLARRPAMPRAFVWAVVLCNAVWAADSVLLLVSGWVSPTALGTAFVIAQAAVVALFVELQATGLKRSASPA